MPLKGATIPEPDANKSNCEENIAPIQQVIAFSSEEENDQENVVNGPEMNGYQPLPPSEQLNVSSDEEDDENPTSSSTADQFSDRTLKVDLDLVRLTMKNIKIDDAAIPQWAKELSDSAWDQVIEQTIGKNTSNELASTSSTNTQNGSSKGL